MKAYLKPSLAFGLGVAVAYELVSAAAAITSHLHVAVLEFMWIMAPVAAVMALVGAAAFGLGLRSRRLIPRRLGRILTAGFVLCALVQSPDWLVKDPLSSWIDLYEVIMLIVFLVGAFVLARSGSIRFAF